MYDKRAQAYAEAVVAAGVDGAAAVAASYLNAFMSFREKDSSQVEKRSLMLWWSALLGEMEAAPAALPRAVRALERAAAWFIKTVAPTGAVLRKVWQKAPESIDLLLDAGDGGYTSRVSWQPRVAVGTPAKPRAWCGRA